MNKQIKELMIEALFARGEFIKQVNDVEIRTRCPFCGDSVNQQKGHLYIRIDVNDNLPMVYNCFKCGSKGIVNKDFLAAMNINDEIIVSSIDNMNKTSDNFKSQSFTDDDYFKMFEYNIPDVKRCDKIYYIENRLGVHITDDDIKKFKIVTSIKDFLKYNKIDKITCPPYIIENLEKNYVGFLSYGNSHLIFRDITNKEKFKWVKYPINDVCRRNKLFYSISNNTDILLDRNIIINLAEGVMDIIGAYYHFDKNAINIAVCGKQYGTVINHLISMGFVGTNIIINIYADNDAVYNNSKNNVPTDINYFNNLFKYLKYLFGSVNIFYNLKEKDIGVPKNNIILKKYKL